MSLFGSKSVLGVDLGTAGIKIAELSRITGERFELKNYGLLDFSVNPERSREGPSRTNEFVRDPQRASASYGVKESAGLKIGDDFLIGGLRDLLNRIKPSTKDAVVSISSFLTFATVIEMPYLSDKDLERAIPFEARKYIPIPLSEVVLDWSIINVPEISQYESGLTSKTGFPNLEIFLVAVSKNEAERYKNIFLSAGVNVKALELEDIALTRVLIGDDNSPLAVVNFGGRSTSIIIIDKGFERVSRNYELGGFEVTRALSVSLGISFERAEELKRNEGLKGSSSFAEAAAPLIDMITFEVKKTITNYEESKKTKIAKIILTGGQSQMPGLKEYFGQKLGKEILIGDPLKKVSFNSALEGTLRSIGPSLAVALGLAMRKI